MKRCPFFIEMVHPSITVRCPREAGHDGDHKIPELVKRRIDKGSKYSKGEAFEVFVRDKWCRGGP